MKKKRLLFLLSIPFLSLSVVAQNVGIGTNLPQEKLHVAGALRVDDLQTALATASVTDKMVWVDANGKVYSFPAGSAGKVLGVNGAGVLAWLNPGVSNSLNNGQIWIGDATNTPVAQTASGDALIDNAGVITIQDDAVDGTDISISGESAGSLMYFNGTDWVNIGIGAAGQVLTISGGVPSWQNLPVATTGNLTSSTPGVSIIGGTGAVNGAGATLNVATNALNQNGLVPAPTAANPLRVWGTDASGNPGWINANGAILTNDVTTTTTGMSVSNGTGQVVGGSNLSVDYNLVTGVGALAVGVQGALGGMGAANTYIGADGQQHLLPVAAAATTNTLTSVVNTLTSTVNGVVATADAVNSNTLTVMGGTSLVSTVNGVASAAVDINPLITKGNLTENTSSVLTITNGTAAVLGTGTSIEVKNNALNQAGVVTGTTAANANQVWGTDGSGNPAWVNPTGLVSVDNGLYYNGVAGKVRQGGNLVENTTIPQANFNMIYDLTGTGNFEVRKSSVTDLFVSGANGNVGIGISVPTAFLDIKGTSAGTNSLQIRSGNISTGTVSNQILFGYNGTDTYRHAIKTRHNSGAKNNNAIDFFIWNAGVDVATDIATKPVMTIDGNSRGMVGVGTTAPKSELHISDASSSLKAVNDDGGYGASLLITDNTVPRIYFENAGQAANKKLMDISLLGQSLSIGSLNDAGNGWDKQYILSAHRDGNVGVSIGAAANKLDVLGGAARSGTHATGRALYVTGTYGAASNGVEFRHDNGTQGIGFGFNTIYATGTNASQDLGLQALGTGGNLLFTTNALERMRVAASGTVGINTTAPDANAKLHINSGAILMSSGGMSSAFTNLPAAQTDNTDFHLFTRTVRPAPNATASDLRLYIEDDGSDAFSIYGNSCGGGGCFNLNNSKQVITFQGDGKIGVNTTSPTGRFEIQGPFYNIANAYKDWSQTSTACFWTGTNYFTQCFTPTQNGVVTRVDLYLQSAPAGTYTLTINGQTSIVINPGTAAATSFYFPIPPVVTGGANTIWTLTSTVNYNMYGNCGGGCGNGTGGATYWNEIYIAPTGTVNSNFFVSDVNGLVGVNTSTPSANLDVVGMLRVTGSFVNASDRRLKKDITTINDPIGIVKQLRGVNYFWDRDKYPEKQFSDKAQIGFIAQEVEAVLPQVVNTAADGYKGVEYANMTALLVEAVKAQQQQIDAQQQEIQRLRGLVQKVAEVEARLAALDGKTANMSPFQQDSPLIAPQNLNQQPLSPAPSTPVLTQPSMNTPVILGKGK